jgi:bacillithiol biosynthesis cysteine-adding enzyme BshC
LIMLPVKFENLSGITKLFLDFINCSGSACKFYKYNFRDLASYKKVAESIDGHQYNRTELAALLQQALEPLNPSRMIEDNIRKLARPDSLVVFAGQQVGMLLGPMYTVNKALTAYKMASRLESELERPVVPCFWMATDDHDFDEVRTVSLLTRAGECKNIIYVPDSEPDGIPMADVVLEQSIDDFLSEVESCLVNTEFSEGLQNAIQSSYQTDRPLAEAFSSLFMHLLGIFGVVPVDPNYPGMKRIMAPVFEGELMNHAEIFDLFEKRSIEIIDVGYHRQVHKTGESLNLFVNDEGRRNIIVENGRYRLDGRGEFLSKDELLDVLKVSPEKFSPNVCLRPVAQCNAFPTVCQVVGPSEAAYFAQIQPLYELLNVPWPVVRPRVFASIIEPHIGKLMKKLSIDFSSLYKDAEHEVSRVIKTKFPPEIQEKAESLRSAIVRPLSDLSDSLKGSDPESVQALEHARKKIDHELNHLSKKLFAAHKKRHDTTKDQVYRAAGFLIPEGKFQERVISPVYYADKFGPGVFKKIEGEIDIDFIGHQLIEVQN